MNIRIMFDFHDVFVDAYTAWINAFYELTHDKNVIVDYQNKISKKIICQKYNLNYAKVENIYRKHLTKIDKNIEFARKIGQLYKIDIVSMSRRDRLLKDIEKFNLEDVFDNVYSKEDVIDRNEFLRSIAINYDWVIYFNHENEKMVIKDNLIYMPIDFQGDLSVFKNKSFTEHAKNKLLYNDLSKYYMQAISNDTQAETNFIKEIYIKNISNTPGKILDCCCGIGRHDYLLGQSEYKVTGIDISKKQIQNAKLIHNNKNVKYVVMDVRNMDLSDKDYDMSICMWTTYNYLSLNEDFIKFIKNNYNHQKEKGILILDSKNIPRLEKRRVYKRNNFIEDKMKMELVINKFVIDNIQNSQYFYFIKEKGEKKFYFDDEFVRFYTLEEIKELVSDYYEVIDVYGDFDFSKYVEKESNRFIVVLRRK